jgi:hypothetical protein
MRKNEHRYFIRVLRACKYKTDAHKLLKYFKSWSRLGRYLGWLSDHRYITDEAKLTYKSERILESIK